MVVVVGLLEGVLQQGLCGCTIAFFLMGVATKPKSYHLRNGAHTFSNYRSIYLLKSLCPPRWYQPLLFV
jgi:hypothetical protein